ncbi:Cys-tRNA(Pro) deacylase [Streptomyces sp. LP05-1]|uniref:Cys-tRNA(Pro)/Cys-tRNA(Cys) deacylase n=1 Tax=Streptomyces pyxinae TaxID=2970734 RepID=A0ABT2CG85_9ACTN|nr:Cys-tRNA(Pro) deacylase [Streptomyces sp. LP05-1]MCS0636429.1 Cys-tRNA(Pro) deacylase [Streptomyces sp. LP05-1]
MAKKDRSGGGRGGTPATVALTAAGTAYTLHAYEHDPASPSYGEEAAEALGVSPERVFKTLVADVDGELTVAVVPVAGQLDLKALAAAVGGKRAAMADPAAAERATGYVRGGISPLGQRKRLRTVLDASAGDHATICVSAGRRGLEVELSPADLAALTGAVLAPVGRG